MSTGPSLATALRCDELVEGLDFGVEQREIALMVSAAGACRDGLAGRHRLIKLNSVSPTILVGKRRIKRISAHRLPAKTSGRELGRAAAIPRIRFRSGGRIEQESDERNNDLQHDAQSSTVVRTVPAGQIGPDRSLGDDYVGDLKLIFAISCLPIHWTRVARDALSVTCDKPRFSFADLATINTGPLRGGRRGGAHPREARTCEQLSQWRSVFSAAS